MLNGGFKIENPNAERTCGCVTFFSAQMTKKIKQFMDNNKNSVIDQRVKEEYKYGFITEIESDTLAP